MAQKSAVNQKKNPKKKKRRRRAGPLCWLGGLAVLCLFGYFLFELIRLGVLPFLYLVIVVLLALAITLFVVYFWLIKTRRPITRWLFGILAVLLGVTYGIGGMFMSDTNAMLSEVTNLTDKMVNVVSVYGLISNKVETPKDLDGGVLGVVGALDPEGTQGIIQQLKDQGVDFTTREYEDPYSLVADGLSGAVDAIALPEQLHDAVYEAANDENKFNALTTLTNIVDQFVYYTNRTEIMSNKPDSVLSVIQNPFVVLISGNDSYGTLSTVSRSDVNMLAVINPKTAQILLVSLPRDTYMEISCKKNKTACSELAGTSDKLTHTGLYGVGTTESSIEDFLGIPINYTIRVNFSSLINIVDAMGGVDVEVEEGLEVDTFYANGTEGVHAGINHLNGERALAFARERHAYLDGDNQRIRNQQILLKALIQQMMSPAMVVRYPDVMKALSTAFETNMTKRDLKSLVTLELSRFPDWNIQSYALSGNSTTMFSPVLGLYTSVTLVDPSQVSYCKDLIDDVLEGKEVEILPDIPAGSLSLEEQQYNFADPNAQPSADDQSGVVVGYDAYGNPIDAYGNIVYDVNTADPNAIDPYAQTEPVVEAEGVGVFYGYDVYGNPIDIYGNILYDYDPYAVQESADPYSQPVYE